MFDFTARITIDSPPWDVWNYMIELEAWWVASNPEHISLEIMSEDRTIQPGTPIRIREKIAGIPGEATGHVDEFVEGRRVTWRAREAVYHFYGLPVRIEEGVTWSIEPSDGGTALSAHVWAVFPATIPGRATEWIFKNILRGVQKDYEHAMRELRHIKSSLET